MKKQTKIQKRVAVFSKWSRKNYAVFASLKRVVKIARLSVDICASSLTKLSTAIRLIEPGKIEADEFEHDPGEEHLFLERLLLLLLGLNINKLENSYEINLNISFSSKPVLRIIAT